MLGSVSRPNEKRLFQYSLMNEQTPFFEHGSRFRSSISNKKLTLLSHSNLTSISANRCSHIEKHSFEHNLKNFSLLNLAPVSRFN